MTKTSNRQKFIKLLDNLPTVSARTNYSYLVIREELIRLYNLKQKELSEEEILTRAKTIQERIQAEEFIDYLNKEKEKRERNNKK